MADFEGIDLARHSQSPYPRQRLDTIKMCHSAKIMSEIFL
jgi:hypothetical protein